MKQEFVLGFAFSQDLTQIVVILKKRPDFLAGKLSVPGGHSEDGDENPQHGIAREFLEETEVATKPKDWRYVETFSGHQDCPVHVFAAKGDEFMAARTPAKSDEPIFVMNVQDVLNDARLDGDALTYIRASLRELRK